MKKSRDISDRAYHVERKGGEKEIQPMERDILDQM
jgi:hypothetical protein